MMSRTGQQRLDAIPAAIERRDAFKRSVEAAGENVMVLADLMAQAISMLIESNHLEAVSRGGKKTVCVEYVMACHCMIYARDAYLRARETTR